MARNAIKTTVPLYRFSEKKKDGKKEKKEIAKFTFGIPKETFTNEARVAATPDSVKLLLKDGH
jgi:hypothetical protein